MQKNRLPLILVVSLFLISFTSAYYGSYGSFSISDLLDSIDSSTMILGAVFIISFIFLHFTLSKFFRDNKTSAGIMAFVVSLFITWGINKTDFDIENLFYGIGISSEILYTILPLVLIAGLIYLFVKFKTKVLFILGGLLILVSFTDLVYEKDLIGFIGIALIGIGIFLWWRKNRKPKASGYGGSYDYSAPSYPSSRDLYKQSKKEQREEWKRQKYAKRLAGRERRGEVRKKEKYDKMREEALRENARRDREKVARKQLAGQKSQREAQIKQRQAEENARQQEAIRKRDEERALKKARKQNEQQQKEEKKRREAQIRLEKRAEEKRKQEIIKRAKIEQQIKQRQERKLRIEQEKKRREMMKQEMMKAKGL